MAQWFYTQITKYKITIMFFSHSFLNLFKATFLIPNFGPNSYNCLKLSIAQMYLTGHNYTEVATGNVQ